MARALPRQRYATPRYTSAAGPMTRTQAAEKASSLPTRLFTMVDEAREIIEQLRALTSVVVPHADHWRNPGQREFYLSGLRLAAGEVV